LLIRWCSIYHLLPNLQSLMWLHLLSQKRWNNIVYSQTIPHHLIQSSARHNPIYLFYEQVANGADGKTVDSDKHYKCCDGLGKILTVMKAMKYSLNGGFIISQRDAIYDILIGLVGHLKHHFPVMYWLYEVLKAHPEPPTVEELDIATGQTKLNTSTAGKYILKLKKASSNIMEALQRQAA